MTKALPKPLPDSPGILARELVTIAELGTKAAPTVADFDRASQLVDRCDAYLQTEHRTGKHNVYKIRPKAIAWRDRIAYKIINREARARKKQTLQDER